MFKKLSHKLFGFSTHTKPTDTLETELPKTLPGIPDENSISIVVDQFYRPIIRINIQNLDDDSAKKFAESLCMLNKGLYQIQIVEMLKELALSDNDRSSFISKVFTYWADYVNIYGAAIVLEKDTPYVAPTSFSKLLTNN